MNARELLNISFPTNGVVKANRFLKFDANGNVEHGVGALPMVGNFEGANDDLSLSTATGKEMIAVTMAGIASVKTAAAITRGGRVKSDADGKAIAAGDNEAVGIAIDASTANGGEVVRVFLCANG